MIQNTSVLVYIPVYQYCSKVFTAGVSCIRSAYWAAVSYTHLDVYKRQI